MVKAKSIIAFVLFLIAFLFIGESYTFFMENFQNSYQQAGYYLMPGGSKTEMRNAIAENAKEHELPVFTMVKENGGAYNRTIILYGDETIWDTLKDDWGIQQGKVSSFFSGNTTFIFKPFSEAPVGEIHDYWYLGNTEQVYAMLYPAMERYSGTLGNEPSNSISRNAVIVGWVLVGLALLLITYYDNVYSKKEQLIKVIFGASSNALLLKKICIDAITFSIAAIAAAFVIKPFTNILFNWQISLACFLAFLICNSILLCFGMKVGKHPQIKMAGSSKKALAFSLSLKWLVMLLTVIVLSICIGLCKEGYNLYSQRGYYEARDNQAHVRITYPYEWDKLEYANGEHDISPLTADQQLMDNFLRYSYKNLDCSVLFAWSFEDIFPSWGNRFVVSNTNGLSDYRDLIAEWDNLCAEEGNFLLVPQGVDKEQLKNDILSVGYLGVTEENLLGVYTYDAELSIIAEGRRGFEYDYTYKIRNPIIMVDTNRYGALPLYSVTNALYTPKTEYGFIGINAAYTMQFAKMENDNALIKSFSQAVASEAINPNLMEFEIIDISGWFNGLWNLQNRALLIAVILTALILILEMQIAGITLRMSYEVNAQELTIKKVMGYSLYTRHKRLFLTTGITCAVALFGSVAAWKIFKVGLLNYFSFGSVAVLLVDLAILAFLAYRGDRVQIQKVLKGGI